MKTTTEFLDGVKRRLELRYDTELAASIGLSKQQISKYRAKQDQLSDEVAGKVAEILELHPGYVLACVHYERAGNSPTRDAWQAIADQFIGIDRTSYNAYYVK